MIHIGVTRRVRRLAAVLTAAVSLSLVAGPAGAQVPPTPPRDKWYAENDTGHFSTGDRVRIDRSCLGLPKPKQVACSLQAFERKPFVVVAFVDTGINPYHQDFRAPEFIHHPSKFISAYPGSSARFDLALEAADAKGYDAGRKADADEWAGLRQRELVWFPGTRVIGGISLDTGGTVCETLVFVPVIDEPCTDPYPDQAVIDDQSHGTGVASVAAGRYFGSNPNALIVMIEGLGHEGIAWAESQGWIDIVSNSWGTRANLPLSVGEEEASRSATRKGISVLFSSGNGATNTNSSRFFPPLPVEDPCKCKTPDSDQSVLDPAGGPSWQLSVGAASPINGQAHWWHSIPVDVSSFGSKWRAAGAFGITPKIDKDNVQTRDFGGTSCATPITAGVLSTFIQRAREVFGDTTEGPEAKQAVAVASKGARLPSKGPLKDGVLTRLEAEEIVQKTAFPVPADPETLTWDYAVRPTGPTYYVYQGYGVVDQASQALGIKVLLGATPMPDRAEVDQFVSAMDALRDAIWGEP